LVLKKVIFLFQKLRDAESLSRKGITILYSESPFAVAIITPLMRTAHELQLQSSREIAFMDSTSCCDAENHDLTFILTPCAAGAVTFGIIITKGQTHDACCAGFQLIQEVVLQSFGGQCYPTILVTHQSQAER
jgi:hypothetical protein